ncbi:hypothetical protein HK097_011444, partial [Rhizophlyctis rosea]
MAVIEMEQISFSFRPGFTLGTTLVLLLLLSPPPFPPFFMIPLPILILVTVIWRTKAIAERMVVVGLEEGAGALDMWRRRREAVACAAEGNRSEKVGDTDGVNGEEEEEGDIDLEMEMEWGWIWRQYLGGGEIFEWEARLEMG